MEEFIKFLQNQKDGRFDSEKCFKNFSDASIRKACRNGLVVNSIPPKGNAELTLTQKGLDYAVPVA